MRLHFLWIFSILLTASVLTGPVTALEIVTDTSVRHQTVDGWGTALWRQTSADPRFRQAYRDAGMNIVRLAMAKEVLVTSPNDFATPIDLGSDLQTNVDLMNLRATSGLIAAAEFAQWLSENALEPDRVKISGSLWTPPHWMKGPTGATQNFVGVTDNHPTPFLSNMVVPWQQHNPIPSGDSVGGRLKTEDPEILRQYGEYLAAWVTGFEQEYGMPIHVMSLQNESTFENPFDSMTFIRDANGNQDFGQYALALKSVKDAWDSHGIETQIKGPHVAHFMDSPSNPYGLWWQNEMIRGVKEHSDPELIDVLDYYNANFYNNTSEGNVKNVAAFYHGSAEVAPGEWTWHHPPGVKQDGKGIWYSETGGSLAPWINGPGGTAGNGAITVALQMFNALVHSNASAYVYWQFADDSANVTQHTLISPAELDDPLTSAKYVSFMHFSRYVRPGAVRIDSTFTDGGASNGGASQYDTFNSVNVSAFLHEDDETLTYVLLNMTGSDESITISLPSDYSDKSFAYFRSTETERFEQHANLAPTNGQLTLSLPRYSLVTLVGGNAEIAPLLGDFNADGIVDGHDFLAWQRGESPNPLSADDLAVWEANFGSPASSDNSATQVPEPSTLLLLGSTGFAIYKFFARLPRGNF